MGSYRVAGCKHGSFRALSVASPGRERIAFGGLRRARGPSGETPDGLARCSDTPAKRPEAGRAVYIFMPDSPCLASQALNSSWVILPSLSASPCMNFIL